MGVINSVAQFERDLLIERTQSGLKRAKAAARCSAAHPLRVGQGPPLLAAS